jgi:hypothetical protein
MISPLLQFLHANDGNDLSGYPLVFFNFFIYIVLISTPFIRRSPHRTTETVFYGIRPLTIYSTGSLPVSATKITKTFYSKDIPYFIHPAIPPERA